MKKDEFNPKISEMKRERKKSFLLHELSSLIRQIGIDEPKILPLFVTKVEMSKDGGVCYIYFSTHTDKAAFDEGLEVLKLYKPSMRKALADAMRSRYVPDLRFLYDTAKEKERRVNALLDKVQDELADEDRDSEE